MRARAARERKEISSNGSLEQPPPLYIMHAGAQRHASIQHLAHARPPVSFERTTLQVSIYLYVCLCVYIYICARDATRDTPLALGSRSRAVLYTRALRSRINARRARTRARGG